MSTPQERAAYALRERWGPRPTPPREEVIRRQLAFDLSHGSLSKAEAIQRLPLFELAMGDPFPGSKRQVRGSA